MSTRFYYGQKDYIEQLNIMDDVATASASSAAASAAAAEQSADDAAASAAAASGAVGTGLANVGLGITSTSPLLADIDDATAVAGFYYVNASTVGTFPVSALPGMVMHKVYGTAGFQMYQPYGSNNLYYRRRSASAWQAWIELPSLATVNTKEPAITAGTTAQYWRGDKTWQTLNKAAVGLSNVDNTSDANKPVSTAQAAADAATLASANSYADGLVVSMWDDRGNYDASGNTFPTTGGSGASGAVKKNDIWTISVAGTLGGTPVAVRQFIRALVDTPGQTSTNWAIGLANTDIDDSITDGVTGRAPSQNAVFDALALKAPLASPALTGTPTAPTAAAGTNTTQLASCAFVQGEKASPTFTGTTTVENVTFSGLARRIRGDFTNATIANRLLFQSSTTNGLTSVNAIPNGTATNSSFVALNGADPDNSGFLSASISNTVTTLNSGKTGTGTALPMTFVVNSNEMAKYDATTYNASLLGAAIEDNGAAYRTLSLGSGTTGSAGTVVSFKDSSGNSRGSIASNTGAGLQLQSTSAGLPMLFYMQGAERMKLIASENRLQADLSNATHASRFMLQSSTANGASVLGIIPAGTGNVGQLNTYNSSDANNSSMAQIGVNATVAYITTGTTGTGTNLPLVFNTAGVERFRIAATSPRIQGNFSQGATSSFLMFQDSTAGALTSVGALPNASSGLAQYAAYNSNSPDNAGFLRCGVDATTAYVISDRTGTGTYLPLQFRTNGAEKMRVTLNGYLLIGQQNEDNITTRVAGVSLNPVGNIRLRASGAQLDLSQSSSSGTNIQFYTDNGSNIVTAGNISSNGSTTAYNTSSDYRLKTSLKPMIGALESLKQIKFQTWIWETDGRVGEGTVAHELAGIQNPIPDAVQGEKDAVKIGKSGEEVPDYQCVDYSKLVPRIGCAVQELSDKLDAALKRIAELEAVK
jgi:hypothetical protein